jgi:hypothetical protein
MRRCPSNSTSCRPQQHCLSISSSTSSRRADCVWSVTESCHTRTRYVLCDSPLTRNRSLPSLSYSPGPSDRCRCICRAALVLVAAAAALSSGQVGGGAGSHRQAGRQAGRQRREQPSVRAHSRHNDCGQVHLPDRGPCGQLGRRELSEGGRQHNRTQHHHLGPASFPRRARGSRARGRACMCDRRTTKYTT